MRKPFSDYATCGGPVPTNGNRIGSAFWLGYRTGRCRAAKGSPAWEAFKAGMMRRKREPGLTP